MVDLGTGCHLREFDPVKMRFEFFSRFTIQRNHVHLMSELYQSFVVASRATSAGYSDVLKPKEQMCSDGSEA